MASKKDDDLGFVEDDLGFVADGGDDLGFVADDDDDFSLAGMGHHVVENLPSYGATIGGIAGGTAAGIPTLGLGAVGGGLAGATAGGALGAAARNLIKSTIMDEPVSTEQILLDPVREGALGAAGEVGGLAIGGGAKLLTRASQELSGVPKEAARVFSERYPEIAKMTKLYGDDLVSAANDARGRISEAIRSFKGDRNSKIGTAINQSLETVDLTPVALHLDEVRTTLDPVADRVAIAKLDSLLEDISSVMARPGNADGNIPLTDADAIKKMINAATDFDPMNASLAKNTKFNAGLTRAGGKANAIMSGASPELKSANKDLSRLHRVTKKANKNLFDQDTPEGALIAAGAGKMPRNENILRRISDLIGVDVTKEAENLGAMSYLGNASLLPKERTGFVAPLMMALGGAGYGAMNEDWETAAKMAATGSIASPLVLKQALKAKYLMNAFPKSIGAPIKGAVRLGTQGLSQEMLAPMLPEPAAPPPPPIPLTEADVEAMNISNTEKAQKLNIIRRGGKIFE